VKTTVPAWEAAAAGGQVRRLNWGCGDHTAPGWINADVKHGPGVDVVGDIRDGLPLDDNSIDYATSVHVLPELPYPDVVPALAELRRVLKPGGVLRLCLPDLDKGISAYKEGRDDYFLVPDSEAQSQGGRFILHMLWHGYSRTLFTMDFTKELLLKAGFIGVVQCRYRQTASAFPEIVELDNRERESLYVEATKPTGGWVPSVAPYNHGVPRNISIEVLDVSLPTHADEHVHGRFRTTAEPKKASELEIAGWVLGRSSRATEVEVLVADEVVGRAPVERKRPDLAKKFNHDPNAATAGFKLALVPQGKGTSELFVRVLLEDGTRAPLGTIRARVGPRGLFRRFRR
jgi:SAM-dependent methyltransferase